MQPSTRPRHIPTSVSPVRLWAEDAVGYRPDDDVPDWQRLLVKVSLVAGGTIVCGLTIWSLNSGGELPRIPQNTRTLLRLDEFTKNAGPAVRNTLPAFLALPGDVGELASDSGPIKKIEEGALNGVVCSTTVATLVRQQFPGYYDQMPDDKLEQVVLEKHPEYRDKLCALPAWMDATAHEIVKYEMKPLPPFRPSVVLWSLLAAAGYGLILLNTYYRVLVPHAARA
jgi:hypothetical protein